MSYRVYHDGTMSRIERSDEEANGYDRFESFAEAKRELLAMLRNHRDEYAWAVRAAGKLTPQDVE